MRSTLTFVVLAVTRVATFAPPRRLAKPPSALLARPRVEALKAAPGKAKRGLKRAGAFLKEHRPAAVDFAKRAGASAARKAVWAAALAPVLTSVHPAFAYVGYAQEEWESRRGGSGSMGAVVPGAVCFFIYTTARQDSRQKKEIKRIKKAHKKIQEEEAEYLAVQGDAESDADIMASLRNRTQAMDDDEDDEDDGPSPGGGGGGGPKKPPPPPPPPAAKKRMTMAEKIAAKQAELDKKQGL